MTMGLLLFRWHQESQGISAEERLMVLANLVSDLLGDRVPEGGENLISSLRRLLQEEGEIPATWAIGLNTPEGAKHFTIQDAARVYLPGPEYPHYVLLIDSECIHAYKYHDIDYLTAST
jgi:hypothetical protein